MLRTKRMFLKASKKKIKIKIAPLNVLDAQSQHFWIIDPSRNTRKIFDSLPMTSRKFSVMVVNSMPRERCRGLPYYSDPKIKLSLL